jgi:23S rRNA (cytosine1962-C5)-methyltransferase
MSALILKPTEDRRIRAGHLWVFSNEIAQVRDLGENGELVDVVSARGRFLGRAYYNKHSLIAARILTTRHEEIDRSFFLARFTKAVEYRAETLGPSRSGRMVFAESDLLPGLIVDKYESWLVVQFLTLGMERLREMVLSALVEVFSPEGILVRNDSPFRRLEALDEEVAVVYGSLPDHVEIEEAGARFTVDLRSGQKTGFFFDQRDNRTVARKLAAGRRVLDCFCYSGGFSISAAIGGAASVFAVDDSQAALDLLSRNAELNDVSGSISNCKADCFSFLREQITSGNRYDLIILDPPAFVKSKSQLKAALAGYREINLSAMKLLAPDGILLTCSCSQNLSVPAFEDVLRAAAHDAQVRLRRRAFLSQAADHPILQAMPETEYLKGFVLQRIS